MICILAGNGLEAYQWARGQNLRDDEWFYPAHPDELIARTNFHVIVVGTAGVNVPTGYFERIYSLAKERGSRK